MIASLQCDRDFPVILGTLYFPDGGSGNIYNPSLISLIAIAPAKLVSTCLAISGARQKTFERKISS